LGAGAFFWPPHLGPPKRGLNEGWAKAGPWARGQIDTSNYHGDTISNNETNIREKR